MKKSKIEELETAAENFFQDYCPRYWHRKSAQTFRSKDDYIDYIHQSEYDGNDLLFKQPEFWDAINLNSQPSNLQEYAECLWVLKNIDRKVQA